VSLGSPSVPLCPENPLKGYTNIAETKRNTMKKTQHKQVDDPDGFDEGTYRLEVCNESFSTSNKVVLTKTNERALAAGGAQ